MDKGFTSYSNAHITDPTISDHLYRLKAVLEAHLGSNGMAKVKITTLAKEIGKHPRTVGRQIKELEKLSNLKREKVGYMYKFYTSPNTSDTYGSTPVSPIMVHGSPRIKRLNKKDYIKNTNQSIPYKEIELSKEESELVEEITRWNCQECFKTTLSEKHIRLLLIGAVQKSGLDAVRKIYKSVAIYGGNPHPKVFWELVKKLKPKDDV